MIRGSRSMALCCAVAAVALHGAGLWSSTASPKVEIEGGAGAAEAMLGSSFADLAAGAAQPVSVAAATPRQQPDRMISPTRPSEALHTAPAETAQTSPPMRVETARQTEAMARTGPPEDAVQAMSPADTVHPVKDAEVAEAGLRDVGVVPFETADTLQASRPETDARATQTASAASDPAAIAARSRHQKATRSLTASKIANLAPQEVIEAAREVEGGVRVSPRPQARPREIEEAAALQRPEPERRTQTNKTSGSNAARDETRGSVSGTHAATAERQGVVTASRGDAQANAAATNYPGEVMRHLARTPRPRVGVRGAALLEFTIGDDGRLASIRLARSSGAEQLDRAALDVVQRAAPFPPPPAGAQRRFSLQINGR